MQNKRTILVLPLSLTVAFCVFCAGFFIGRSTVRGVNVATRRQPPAEQTAIAPTAASTEDSSSGQTIATQGIVQRININTATAEQLQALPGIGAVLAQRIVDYRTENGAFACIGDLTLVSGIGEKSLEKLIDYITVEVTP